MRDREGGRQVDLGVRYQMPWEAERTGNCREPKDERVSSASEPWDDLREKSGDLGIEFRRTSPCPDLSLFGMTSLKNLKPSLSLQIIVPFALEETLICPSSNNGLLFSRSRPFKAYVFYSSSLTPATNIIYRNAYFCSETCTVQVLHACDESHHDRGWYCLLEKGGG